MSERIECEGCGGQIHPRFATCPLCGHVRRERVGVGPSSLDDDAPSAPPERALPRWSTAPAEVQVTGMRSALRSALLPAPHTRGWMRVTELLLTLIAAPLFVIAALALATVARRWSQLDVVSWLMGAVFGSALLGLGLAYAVGLDWRLAIKTILVCLAAWTLRSVVRALSSLRERDG